VSEEEAADGESDWFEEALAEDADEPTEGTDGAPEAGAGDSPAGATEAESPGEEGGGESPWGDGDGEESPWGEDAGEQTPWRDAAGGGAGEMFEDDFGTAFDAGDDGEFDDDAVDSSIPRIDLGIEGLDEMIQGGIPERHLLTCIGGAGSGKTTFGLQFLHHGLQRDQKGVFITLEQSHEAIMDTANERGWDFEGYEDEGTLAIVDLDPVEMANSLDNIRGELPGLIEQFGADRLVLDSVSLLEMMYENQADRRTEVFDFTRSLKKAGVTTFLTSEASETNPYASRHGIIEYLTDGVFILQYVRGESQETRLAVEIQKIRNANHSRDKKPYEITLEGISVYQQANIF